MRRICFVALVAVLSMAACGPSGATPTPSPGGGGEEATIDTSASATPHAGGSNGNGGGGGGGEATASSSTAPTSAAGSSASGLRRGGEVAITRGSGTVTLTTDVSCQDSELYGMVVLAGDQQSGDGKPDGISIMIPHDPSLHAVISGSVGGKAFALGPDARGTVVNGDSGTWSGKDILGSNIVFSGTFTCP